MNYLIKIATLLVFTTSVVFSQENVVIEVVGEHSWIEVPTEKSIEFDFSENGKTCGPNTAFETIDEQVAFLKFELLKNNDIAKRIVEVSKLQNITSRFPRRTYSVTYKTEEEGKLIYEMAKEAFAEKIKLFHHFKQDQADEYLSPYEQAIEDAKKKANTIAKNLGYAAIEIVSMKCSSGIAKGDTKNNATFDSKGAKRKLTINIRFELK